METVSLCKTPGSVMRYQTSKNVYADLQKKLRQGRFMAFEAYFHNAMEEGLLSEADAKSLMREYRSIPSIMDYIVRCFQRTA